MRVSAVAWTPLIGSGEKQALWAAVLLKLASDRSEEWGSKSVFPLSVLTMKAVMTGLSETKYLPCDSDQLTACNLSLERAEFHEAKRSYFQMASPI